MSDTHRYHDEGTVWIQWAYRKQLDLAPGTNLIHHYFERIGLPDWSPNLRNWCVCSDVGGAASCSAEIHLA